MEVSFEFFPPRTQAGEIKLREVWKHLDIFKPSYCSVTYGAGGSTQKNTAKTIYQLQADGLMAASHLSCIGSTRQQMAEILDEYQQNNVKHLVVLRGDFPSGMVGQGGDFRYASELVRFIRETTGDYFYIDVAAYPEFHPQAPDAFSDLRYFKEKVSAGANAAITQYFYSIDAFERFLDSCQKMQIEVPIVPGIMPIYEYKKLMNFSTVCGAEIPRWLEMRLRALQDDEVGLQEYGVEVVANLCQQLQKFGVQGWHFYCLNQSGLVSKILTNLHAGISQRCVMPSKTQADVGN